MLLFPLTMLCVGLIQQGGTTRHQVIKGAEAETTAQSRDVCCNFHGYLSTEKDEAACNGNPVMRYGPCVKEQYQCCYCGGDYYTKWAGDATCHSCSVTSGPCRKMR
ncbi:unnamed protein product [Symbiodinium microadriaticum]|nr:unnamed protein product [Symbiodinium microadriaticum]CAE7946480.1 unnamed protein product [Symbiodinium sp. KB8]